MGRSGGEDGKQRRDRLSAALQPKVKRPPGAEVDMELAAEARQCAAYGT